MKLNFAGDNKFDDLNTKRRRIIPNRLNGLIQMEKDDVRFANQLPMLPSDRSIIERVPIIVISIFIVLTAVVVMAMVVTLLMMGKLITMFLLLSTMR